MKAYRFLMGNLFFNLGFVVVSFSGAWGDAFGTDFYTGYFLSIFPAVILGIILSMGSAAAVSYIIPSSTKAVAYGIFSFFFWTMWAQTTLIFANFTIITGSMGVLIVSIYLGIGIILFVVGITQSELGGWASHE